MEKFSREWAHLLRFGVFVAFSTTEDVGFLQEYRSPPGQRTQGKGHPCKSQCRAEKTLSKSSRFNRSVRTNEGENTHFENLSNIPEPAGVRRNMCPISPTPLRFFHKKDQQQNTHGTQDRRYLFIEPEIDRSCPRCRSSHSQCPAPVVESFGNVSTNDVTKTTEDEECEDR